MTTVTTSIHYHTDTTTIIDCKAIHYIINTLCSNKPFPKIENDLSVGHKMSRLSTDLCECQMKNFHPRPRVIDHLPDNSQLETEIP